MSIWDDGRGDRLLRKARARGESFTVIAKAISALAGQPVSRCACIGRARRIGLGADAPRVKETQAVGNLGYRMAKAKHSPPPPPRARVNKSPPPTVLSPNARPWLERGKDQCRWPIDAGSRPADTLSCCNPCGDDGYCRPHWQIMHQPRSAAATAKTANQIKKAA